MPACVHGGRNAVLLVHHIGRGRKSNVRSHGIGLRGHLAGANAELGPDVSIGVDGEDGGAQQAHSASLRPFRSCLMLCVCGRCEVCATSRSSTYK